MHASIASKAPFTGHSEENMPSSWPENRFLVGPHPVNNRKTGIKHRIPGETWLKSTNNLNNSNKYYDTQSDTTTEPKDIDNNNNSTNDDNADPSSCIAPRTPPINIPFEDVFSKVTLNESDTDRNKKLSDSSISGSSCISSISSCSASDEGFYSGSFYESSCNESYTETWLRRLKENRPKKKLKKKEDGRTRLIDEDGFIRRAAIICVNTDHSQVLLVSSKDHESWLIPGGGLEAGEEGSATATREAWEEAGVVGDVLAHLGQVETSHHSGCKKHRTDVYLIGVKEVKDEYPESYLGRDRGWFALEDAHHLLMRYKPQHAGYLQKYLVTSPSSSSSSSSSSAT